MFTSFQLVAFEPNFFSLDPDIVAAWFRIILTQLLHIQSDQTNLANREYDPLQQSINLITYIWE